MVVVVGAFVVVVPRGRVRFTVSISASVRVSITLALNRIIIPTLTLTQMCECVSERVCVCVCVCVWAGGGVIGMSHVITARGVLVAPRVISTKATLSGYDAAIELRVNVRVGAFLIIITRISRTLTA